MNKFKSPLMLALSFLLLISCSFLSTDKKNDIFNYPDIINITNEPDSVNDLNSFCQFDLGSWFGYSLPEEKNVGKIVGPFSAIHSEWLSNSIAELYFINPKTNQEIKKENYINVKIHSYPGVLKQTFDVDSIRVNIKLFFASTENVIVNFAFQNLSKIEKKLIPAWQGKLFPGYKFNLEENILSFDFNKIGLKNQISLCFGKSGRLQINQEKSEYYYHLNNQVKLKPSEVYSNVLVINYSNDKSYKFQKNELSEVIKESEGYYKSTISRWNKYLKNIFDENSYWNETNKYDIVAVKSLITLINNWKSPLGVIKHDGLFPSYSTGYFNGFWAWDSWKHAVALTYIDPELAKNQILTMYDFQSESGMIVDCFNTDETNNYDSWNFNWLNTKPPLSAWAVWEVYKKSEDLEFLKSLYPKIKKYHYWWYENRDNNQNQLCEYGSSLAKDYACKWESGMDDGVRFDSSKILKNNDNAYSLNQESMDLNSFLAYEKNILSLIANELGYKEDSKQYIADSKIIKKLINEKMYDQSTNFYYDINIKSNKHIKVQGSEGWIPLWTKVADKENAAKVISNILDPDKFATYIPLPTMAKDQPGFFTGSNYWRGPVWIDQVYFGIHALKNYGFDREAKIFTEQIFTRLKGLNLKGPSIRENYNPLNGEGKFGENFSWSAAHLLLLYMEK